MEQWILPGSVRLSFLGLSQGGTLAPNQAETNCGVFALGKAKLTAPADTFAK